ncbi:MAG: hypothetical protein LBK13_10180 [Spirochaetales bacterium]|jgi:hypothetical protein|nr:hypothetical protein [Spirochaetales bacterium]
MKDTVSQGGINGESYDYSKDFKILTPVEKWEILKSAKNLLKLQKENTLLADVSASPVKTGKQGLV